MKSLALRSFIIAVSYLVLLSCAKPKSEVSCGFIQNVYGERVSWKSTVPVRMYLHNSVPTQFDAAIRRAAETWNKAYGRTILIIENNRVGGGGPARDTTNVIYFMNTWEVEKASEQGRTSLAWVGDQIQEADIRINARYFTFYSPESPSTGSVSIEALLLHEFGHVLGLQHNDSSPSVMATYLNSYQNRVQLQSKDSESLKCEY